MVWFIMEGSVTAYLGFRIDGWICIGVGARERKEGEKDSGVITCSRLTSRNVTYRPFLRHFFLPVSLQPRLLLACQPNHPSPPPTSIQPG